jgi:hypothetical protein
LTGWGAPGSASSDDPGANEGRRSWTCWCVVHRPPTSSATAQTSLIIMEFELEQDTFHPLYPPIHAHEPSFISPPTESGHTSKADTSMPMSDSPDKTLSDHSIETQDTWTPSAEDILKSTTSHSKPLLALERLRRMTRVSALTPYATPRPGRRRQKRIGVARQGPGVGIMDVFAVMAQIKEQLGTATDLDTFLNVLVGVVKDLTQFHRVLVYQFDETWNGHVLAELVDRDYTHDLYRGLHFPDSDIPVQVSSFPFLIVDEMLIASTAQGSLIVCNQYAFCPVSERACSHRYRQVKFVSCMIVY